MPVYIANVTIDANPIEGVAGIEADWDDAPAQTTGDGGEVTTARTKGGQIRLRIEPGRATGIYAYIVGLRGDVVPHVLAFTDPDGTAYSYNVNWKAKPPLRIGLPGRFDAIWLVFTERP